MEKRIIQLDNNTVSFNETDVNVTKKLTIGGQLVSSTPTGTESCPNPPMVVESTDKIENLNADMVDSHTVNDIIPVGTIIALYPQAPAPNSQYWLLCDGQPFPDGSAFTGNSPDLSDNRFLMGSTSVGAGGSNSQSHNHSVYGHYHSKGNTSISGGGHRHVTCAITSFAGGTSPSWGEKAGVHGITGYSWANGWGGITSSELNSSSNYATHTHSLNGNIGNTTGLNGDSQQLTSPATSDSRPQYFSVKYYIKYR